MRRGLHLVCMSAESLELACERGFSFGLHFAKALFFFLLWLSMVSVTLDGNE